MKTKYTLDQEFSSEEKEQLIDALTFAVEQAEKALIDTAKTVVYERETKIAEAVELLHSSFLAQVKTGYWQWSKVEEESSAE